MKRAPSEDLFRLIRSLSKGEKRNFKMLAGLIASDKDKKYIELFDVIDKQDVYDEGKIIKQLKHLYGGQLAVGKHYLFKLILNSLVYYSSNPGAELRALVEQVKIVAAKDLYPQAMKLLRKGLQQAIDIEDFVSHYALQGLQLELMLRAQQEKDFTTRIGEIECDRVEIMAKMANLDAYRALNHRAFALVQTRQVASGDLDLALLAALTQDRHIADPSLALSIRARIEYLSIQRKISSLNNDLDGAIGYCNELLELYDTKPALKDEYIRDYFSELANVCTYMMRLGRAKEAFSKMDEIRGYRLAYPRARLDFFQLFYVVHVAAALHVGEPERAIAIEEEIEAEWAIMEGKVPKAHEMWLRYLMAYANFMLGNSSRALRWVNHLLREPRSDLRLDIQINARLLNLLIHYELGNFLLVESEVISTKRFLVRHEQYIGYERLVLRAIKAVSVSANGPQAQVVKENWRNKLQRFDEGKLKNVSRMIDVAEWIQAKIEGRSMAALRKEKIKSHDLKDFLL